MATPQPLPLNHQDPAGEAEARRCKRAPFSFMSDFERRGVIHLFPLAPGAPLVTDGADEIVPRDQARSVHWSDAALVLDLMLGERLALLKEGSQLMRIGYARLGDFCREELGISPRLASELIHVHRELERFPLLRGALLSGEVNRSALRHILPAVTTETEDEWVMRAKSLTVREIEAEAQKLRTKAQDPAAGTLPPGSLGESDEHTGETITVKASPSLAWKWDTARELFHRIEGADCSPQPLSKPSRQSRLPS